MIADSETTDCIGQPNLIRLPSENTFTFKVSEDTIIEATLPTFDTPSQDCQIDYEIIG